jgi:hypothetical protein
MSVNRTHSRRKNITVNMRRRTSPVALIHPVSYSSHISSTVGNQSIKSYISVGQKAAQASPSTTPTISPVQSDDLPTPSVQWEFTTSQNADVHPIKMKRKCNIPVCSLLDIFFVSLAHFLQKR